MSQNTIKTWQERFVPPSLPDQASYMEREITAREAETADLRARVAELEAALSRRPAAAPQANERAIEAELTAGDFLRDILAIQKACDLHTDEYAPGDVIEYIKELENAAGQGKDSERLDFIASNPSFFCRWRMNKGREQWQAVDDGEPQGKWHNSLRAAIDAAMKAGAQGGAA